MLTLFCLYGRMRPASGLFVSLGTFHCKTLGDAPHTASPQPKRGQNRILILPCLPHRHSSKNPADRTPSIVSLSEEMKISMQAGEIVGKLYDAFYRQYKNPENEHSQKSLNALCVRLVFCLYAEDSGLFGSHAMFHDYLASYKTGHMRKTLINLFKVLDLRFLDALRAELIEIEVLLVVRAHKARLEQFQEKLASLTFLENCTSSLIRATVA